MHARTEPVGEMLASGILDSTAIWELDDRLDGPEIWF